VRAMYLFLTKPSLYGLCSVAATCNADVRDVSGIGMTMSGRDGGSEDWRGRGNGEKMVRNMDEIR
jgi:hypothetical protein